MFLVAKLNKNLARKKRISTPLMRENPVSSPNVPPIVDSMSVKVAATSLVTSSKAGVSM